MVTITLSIAAEYEDTYRPNTGTIIVLATIAGGLAGSVECFAATHETLPNVLLLRCLPNERYQATPHRVPVLRVTGQFLNEQFLLIEDSPNKRGRHQEKYQEVPPRPERETHADEQ